jgi:hypothetical protein
MLSILRNVGRLFLELAYYSVLNRSISLLLVTTILFLLAGFLLTSQAVAPLIYALW